MKRSDYAVTLVNSSDFVTFFQAGPVMYYRGESIGSASCKMDKVRRLAAFVYKYVIEERRGVICHKRVVRGPNGLHCWEYWARPSKEFLGRTPRYINV